MTTPTEQSTNPANPAAATDPANPATTPASASTAIEQPKVEDTDLGAGEPEKAADPNAPAEAATDLGGEDKPEDKPVPGADFQGFPEDGNITVNAPDGFAVDEALLEDFKPVAKDLNLNAKGIQKLLDLKLADTKRQLQNWGDHLKKLKTDAQADPEIGGAKYNGALAVSKAAISKFAGPRAPAFRKMLNAYGVGAHPEMIRFLSAVGAATGETPTLSGGDAGEGANKPLHDILYK